MSSELVKIFGERNSATNALGRLIASNSASQLLPSTESDIDLEASRAAWAMQNSREREAALDRIYAGIPDPFSWKHCATNFSDATMFENIFVLFCLRHPASWLTSLFRNPYHILTKPPASIAEFINYRWETALRERLQGASLRPLELYNAKVESYVGFADRLNSAGIAFAFVRQEDLLLDQEHAFRSVAAELLRPRRRFRAKLRSAKKGWMPLYFVRRYYAAERWRDSVAGLEDAINEQVDWSIFEKFGYHALR